MQKLVQQRVYSGIQPTGGGLHLGNVLGAVSNWVNLLKKGQTRTDSLFCVVDLHAITVYQEPSALRAAIRKTAVDLLACGLDPSSCVLYRQSQVPGHSQLQWLLGTLTPLSRLNLMTQFKEKNKAQFAKGLNGLFSYPVLMAADVLLFRANVVSVGEDQRQHLELTRDLAGIFNSTFAVDYFPIPQPLFTQTARIMSLSDAKSKMSKSAPNADSRIELGDSPDDIRRKIRAAKTDHGFSGFAYDPVLRPEVSNLMSIYASVTNQSMEDATRDLAALTLHSQLKERLTDALISYMKPINERQTELLADLSFVDRVLADGAVQANEIASETMRDVHRMMGLD
eukprot:gnl/Spiro4/24958_TR12408_c0_g1_i1.p1 gnl/Spiro4/24958_TR12408_c0_g1~~gnl/Spiro4/24958_TR12408_c0_g1_i1.p1  ORF type:complete len:340 (+),score=45.78 gnl/Spiro4/24958_TR12408_c0_g1_i1:101-1120(+)